MVDKIDDLLHFNYNNMTYMFWGSSYVLWEILGPLFASVG